ncbi:LOW QUALITY PROTEIN: hypothetical protein PHMEG_00033226, partial [Phytophthora megakarya]
MTMRARKISAFLLAPNAIRIKESPMIYQRMIDNALWGFVQPKCGWERYTERMKLTEESAKHQRSLDDNSDFTLTTTRTKFEADRQASSELDPVLRMVNDPYPDMFATNEPDESSLVPVFQRRSFVDDICFGGTIFDDCLNTLDKLLARLEECRISVSFTKSIFCQSKVDFLSHEVSPEGIRPDPKKMTAITKLPFPKSNRFIQNAVYGAALYQLKEDDFSEGGDLAAAKESFTALQRKVADTPILRYFDAKKEIHIMLYANEWALSATLMQMHDDCPLLWTSPQGYRDELSLGREGSPSFVAATQVQVAVLLPPWQLEVQRVREKDCVFTQLLQSTITNFVDLDDSLALVAPPTKGSPSTRLDPSLLYAQLPHDYEGFVVSFDGSAKTEKNGGYASAYLEQTTVNMAEYSGMNHGAIAALQHGADNLVIVGDSRLAIQQTPGVVACRFANDLLNRHRDLRSSSQSDICTYVGSKVSKVVLNDHRKTELKELNRTQEMIYEPSSDDIKVENTSSETFAQIPDGKTSYIHTMDSDILLQRKTYADFAHQEHAEVSATTR